MLILSLESLQQYPKNLITNEPTKFQVEVELVVKLTVNFKQRKSML